MKREQILFAVTIVSVTVATYSVINQRSLNNIIVMQNAKISELIKAKKDFQFSNQVSTDSSLTSMEELKKLVKELSNKTTAPGQPTSNQTIGVVTINSGVTMVNIYDSPSASANILSSTLPQSVLFFYQKVPGWHQVEYGVNQTGWVADEVLTETTP